MRSLVTLTLAAFAAASFVSNTDAQDQWGDLTIQFAFKGDAPAAKKIDPNRDQQFCGKHEVLDESLVIGADGGIKNVIVYAYEGRGGVELPGVHPELKDKNQTIELANKGCRFEPHVVICRTGDTLKVTNPDPVGHNVNLPFLVNTAVNLTVAPGKFVDVALENAEPAPIPTECNIHPWMQAKVVVLDHPYVAKSDDSGKLTIKNLPAGKLAFRLYHESAGRLSGLEIGDGEVDRRNVFEVEIKAGANDLGKVELDAEQLGVDD